MTISTTLRPGLLVALKTNTVGNIQYTKTVIEDENVTSDGASKAVWETQRVIFDPVEHDAAAKARSKCRSLISAVCAQSAFGLLCPEDSADLLEKAIADARATADKFNRTAKLSRVEVFVITGKIAPTDQEAVKAINNEVNELLAQMETGLKNFDVKSIRDAANRAKDLGAMLPADTSERVKIAVDTAREAARKIVKAGETASKEIDQQAIRKITEQRTAFLDLDAQADVAQPDAEGRALDLAPTTVTAPITPAARTIEIE